MKEENHKSVDWNPQKSVDLKWKKVSIKNESKKVGPSEVGNFEDRVVVINVLLVAHEVVSVIQVQSVDPVTLGIAGEP